MLSEQLIVQQLVILARLTGWMSFLTLLLWFSLRGGLKLSPTWQARLCWVILLSGWSYFPGQWVITPPAIISPQVVASEESLPSVFVGAEPVPVLRPSVESALARSAQSAIPNQTARGPFEEEFLGGASFAEPVVIHEVPLITPVLIPPPPVSDQKTVPEAQPWFTNVFQWCLQNGWGMLWGTWVIGLLFLFVRGVFRWRRFWMQLPGEVAVPDAWNAEIASWLPAGKQRFRLHWTKQLGPLLCWHPRGTCLLLPSLFWEKISPAQRQAIIQHEVAHWRRGDVWWQLWASLLALPHWFNPCAWWLQRRIEDCAEWCCDELAAAQPEQRTSYAQALLQVVEYAQPRLAVGSGMAGGALAERIRRIVSPVPVKETFMRKVVLIVAVMLITFAAGFRYSQRLQGTLEGALVDPMTSVAGESNSIAEVTDTRKTADSSPSNQPATTPFPKPVTSSPLANSSLPDATPPTPVPGALPRMDVRLIQNTAAAHDSLREKVLERVKDAYLAAFQQVRNVNGSVEVVYIWSSRWARVLQEQTPLKAAREHHSRMEELLTLVNTSKELFPQQSAVQFYLAEAELQLFKAETQAVHDTVTPPLGVPQGPPPTPYPLVVPPTPESVNLSRTPPTPTAPSTVVRERLIRKAYSLAPLLEGLQSPYRDNFLQSLSPILSHISPNAFVNFQFIQGANSLSVTTTAQDQKRIEKTLQLIQLVKSKTNATDPTQGAEEELETREYQLPINAEQLEMFLGSFPGLLFRAQQLEQADSTAGFYADPIREKPKQKVSSIPEVHQLLDVMFNPQADLDKPVEGIVPPPLANSADQRPMTLPDGIIPNSIPKGASPAIPPKP